MYPYIPITDEDIKEMLSDLGMEDISELHSDIADEIKLDGELDLPESMSELEVYRFFNELAKKNVSVDDKACFMGGGAYDRYIPSIIDKITGRSEFYTSYTPYQAEISQGTLSYIFEYQTMMAELTGKEYSNASLYDRGTGVAEAVFMLTAMARKDKVVVSEAIHPDSLRILETYTHARGIELVRVPVKDYVTDMDALEEAVCDKTAAVVMQQPNFYGYLEDTKKFDEITHAVKRNYLVATVDPISLGVLNKPSEYNADIVVGDGQSLGLPLNYGGPYLGFMTFDKEFIRRVPGRIIGATKDRDDKRAFVMTLAAREQHIRRDKATSNICSNQGLNALGATVYMATMGAKGISEVAEQSLQKAHYLYNELSKLDKVKTLTDKPFFQEFVIGFDKPAEEVLDALFENDILGGLDLKEVAGGDQEGLIIAVTEKRTKDEMDKLVKVIEEVL